MTSSVKLAGSGTELAAGFAASMNGASNVMSEVVLVITNEGVPAV